MPSILRLAVAFALLAVSAEAAEYGKECYSNSDCVDGATCVAGDSVNSVQRCVAGDPCGGSAFGGCPGDEKNGQLACIWREDAKACSNSPGGCATIDGTLGIYKCISLDRCDSYFSGQCSGACNVGDKQCNGRGTCLLSDKSTAAKPAFECACNSGWNGTRCDNVVDDTCVIDAGQCGKFGTCVKNSCACSNGYTGDQCQIKPKTDSSSGSLDPSDPSTTTKSPVPAPSTTAPNSSASRANSNTEVVKEKTSGGGPSALVIIMAVLVALIVVGVIAFIFVARKRRREQEAANAGGFNRTDSVIAGTDGERPPTPKQKIVIM